MDVWLSASSSSDTFRAPSACFSASLFRNIGFQSAQSPSNSTIAPLRQTGSMCSSDSSLWTSEKLTHEKQQQVWNSCHAALFYVRKCRVFFSPRKQCHCNEKHSGGACPRFLVMDVMHEPAASELVDLRHRCGASPRWTALPSHRWFPGISKSKNPQYKKQQLFGFPDVKMFSI